MARTAALRKLVLSRGVGLFTNSDSEIIAQMLARPHDPAEAAAFAAQVAPAAWGGEGEDGGEAGEGGGAGGGAGGEPPLWAAWVARMAAFMRDCEGAYSLTALTKDAVYGIRDPYGLRPLCVGKKLLEDGSWSYHLSSESCALATVGATLIRDVAPGEIVRLSSKGGFRAWRPISHPPALGGSGALALAPPRPLAPLPPHNFCIFEYVYFARPDSKLEGRHVHAVRTRLGQELAREAPPLPSVDLVSGVPDSSVAAAIGYANSCKLPFSEVFCKNRYIGRTFIKPDDTLRKNAIQLKYNPLPDVLAGKSIILVDDSLVRGNTLRQLVPLLRGAGAKEVHVRISSPPIRHPCYYGERAAAKEPHAPLALTHARATHPPSSRAGVDIGSHEELIITHVPTVEGLREYIGADSLAYLSFDGMVAAVEGGVSDERKHCTGCFTGEYPIEHDQAGSSPAVSPRPLPSP